MAIGLIAGALFLFLGVARLLDLGGVATRAQERLDQLQASRGDGKRLPANTSRRMGYGFLVAGVLFIVAGVALS